MLLERATFEDGTFGVEAGLFDMLDRMQTGRWKVAAHLGPLATSVRKFTVRPQRRRIR